MISKKEIEHLAKLARIGMTSEEIEKMQKELSAILDYFEKLKEVDVSGVELTPYVVKLKNVMRKDKERIGSNLPTKEELSRKILNQAPMTEKNYLKVKSIFENESY